jgi:NAD(P)-dependent dehydrogenase (short-subunit alcohol dehydrogenase family)
MPVAVVTGAGGGLGRAIALDLASRGYLIQATDVDAAAAAETAAQIGAGASSAELDVTDGEACRALAVAAAAATRSGRLDLWVNNAGVLITGPSWQQDEATRRTMLDVNALGTMNGTVAALEKMLPTGNGHVINVISLAGLVAAPGEVNYSASKHAAMAFTLGTLFDLRRSGIEGIEISAVCPDGIWTPMLADKLDDPAAAGSFSGELLTPERVATEVGKLTERPRPLLVLPRWRGPLLRLFDLFPRFALRLLPLVMRDAQRRQRRYKRLIEAGKWP